MTIKKRLYANNAKTTLALDITPADTVIQVTDGSTFPSPALGEYFLATLEFGSSIEIVKVTGRSGNSFTGCIRGQEGTTALSYQAGIKVGNRVTKETLDDFERGIGLMDRVDSLDLLDIPARSSSNAYICNSKDSSGNSSVAIKNSDTTWRFLTHSTISVVGSASGGSTTSLNSTAIGNKLISIVPGKYIVQFITGNNRGYARMVTSVNNNTLGWFTPLPEFPAVGDQFEVYMSDSSTLGDGTGIIPITSGGTGGITPAAALTNLGAVAKGGDTLLGALNFAAPISITIANSAAVGGSNSNNITLTGTGNVTSFGNLAPGGTKTLTFTGIATLVYNPTTLILPSAANIITAAGDTATIVSIGVNSWKVISYQKFNGQPLIGNNSTEYVQQGGGIGQSTNKVFVGWGTAGGLKSTVDTIDQGFFTFSSSKDELRTWQNINTTGAISSAVGFTGDGTNITNVSAINTASISNATDKQYGWTGVQYFYSPSQPSIALFGPPNTTLRVSDKAAGSAAAAMSFVRENIYGLNVGIGVSNNFIIGGYSVNGPLLQLTPIGDLLITGAITGTFLYGDGSNITNLTAAQISGGLGFTPVQQGTGVGQLANKIRIGYSVPSAGYHGVKVTVDNTDFGFIAFSRLSSAWSTEKQIITDASVTASYFEGNGGGLTNVTAIDTSSITSALNKANKWVSTGQLFPSYSQAALVETPVGSTHAQLQVVGSASGAAVISFAREGVYGVNVGLDVDNAWGIGGYSSSSRLFAVDQSGNVTAKTSMTAPAYFGNIGNCTGMISSQIINALGWTPAQQGGGIGQSTNKVFVGWGTGGGLKVTVDSSDQGWVPFSLANPVNGTLNFNQRIISLGYSGDGSGLTGVTSVNTNSLSNCLDGAWYWRNINSFPSFRNINYPGDGGGLVVRGESNAAALMTFVRPSAFGLNLGIDFDNVFKIGGYSAGGSTLLSLDTGGNLTTLGNITAYSDKRIKKNIQPIKNALSNLLKLKGVTFDKISDDTKGRGFVAQEVEEVYPELVHTEISGEHIKSIAYGNFAGDIVEALRELDIRLKKIEDILNIKAN